MQLKLHTYRYGDAGGLPGLALGVARFLPRNIRREDYAARGYFDVWLPLLAPSRELVAAYRKGSIDHETFASRYRKEMKEGAPAQVIRLLAAQAARTRINLGCFCEDASRCHRSVLAALIQESASASPGHPPPASVIALPSSKFSSPACSMPEIKD
ncbi:DUF488 family protein [Termitidicoccus mucosus]|uniref:DUF488 domain-containing protein n=1 Tax=Termitidicoccus mucosus TaxID=1184151 RepID=A0A178IL67_9BACT|nr:hypothetical protein AW736_09680 [Opitutaceae bacterium TSB47]